jgi:hypothetical protein
MRECTRSFQGNYRSVHVADLSMTLLIVKDFIKAVDLVKFDFRISET